jgi:hypothetical protein
MLMSKPTVNAKHLGVDISLKKIKFPATGQELSHFRKNKDRLKFQRKGNKSPVFRHPAT